MSQIPGNLESFRARALDAHALCAQITAMQTEDAASMVATAEVSQFAQSVLAQLHTEGQKFPSEQKLIAQIEGDLAFVARNIEKAAPFKGQPIEGEVVACGVIPQGLLPAAKRCFLMATAIPDPSVLERFQKCAHVHDVNSDLAVSGFLQWKRLVAERNKEPNFENRSNLALSRDKAKLWIENNRKQVADDLSEAVKLPAFQERGDLIQTLTTAVDAYNLILQSYDNVEF